MLYSINSFNKSKRNGFNLGLSLIALSIILVSSCQKETTGIAGSSSFIDQPPAGFLFPHTYSVSSTPAPYELYNNGKLVQPNTVNKDVYFKSSITIVESGDATPNNIIFKDKSTVSIEGYPDYKFYFKDRVLNILVDADTFEFANGNYESFKVYCNMLYFAQRINSDTYSRQNQISVDLIPNSLPNALKEVDLNSLSDIKELDTLALYSIIQTYK
ncbi:MAG: hypothetical protein SGJ00_07250 [bacterium]|nr:hypothetical protein [bacterium]